MKCVLYFILPLFIALYSQADTLYLRLPEYIYTTTTSQYSVYYNNIILTQYPEKYSFVVNCPVGYNDGNKYNLDSLNSGIYNFNLEVYDSVGTFLETDASQLIVTENSINYNDTLKILFVGNSLTYGGRYARYVKEFLDEYSILPVKLLGTSFYTEQDSIDGIFHQGVSGYKWANFTLNIESPFVYSEYPGVDVERYIEEELDGETPDIVTIFLGINDILYLPHESDIDSIDANLDYIFIDRCMGLLIDKFEEALPNTPPGIGLIPVANERTDVWYTIYGDSLRGWTHRQYQHRLVQRYIDHYNDLAKPNFSMIPIYPNIDTFSGYPETNAVHPNLDGYAQIANTFYGWIKYQISQWLIAPENLTINTNENSISLNWDSSPGISLYNIYRSLDPYSNFQFIGSTVDVNFTDHTISGSSKYFYRVTSDNSMK
ncbi:MAG: hypothetical protein KAS62_12380 [Candidatus Delongbacteria bacterium]|nr:hypothetical protein [Candidatus Delongbacteria bacterium]